MSIGIAWVWGPKDPERRLFQADGGGDLCVDRSLDGDKVGIGAFAFSPADAKELGRYIIELAEKAERGEAPAWRKK